jgi:hypothetical protein
MPDTFSKPPWGGLPTAPQSLLEPEFEKPWRAYAANQTPQTADKLLGAAAPVIDEALKSYGGGEAQSPALRARAKVLTLEAARKFDPTRARTNQATRRAKSRSCGSRTACPYCSIPADAP